MGNSQASTNNELSREISEFLGLGKDKSFNKKLLDVIKKNYLKSRMVKSRSVIQHQIESGISARNPYKLGNANKIVSEIMRKLSLKVSNPSIFNSALVSNLVDIDSTPGSIRIGFIENAENFKENFDDFINISQENVVYENQLNYLTKLKSINNDIFDKFNLSKIDTSYSVLLNSSTIIERPNTVGVNSASAIPFAKMPAGGSVNFTSIKPCDPIIDKVNKSVIISRNNDIKADIAQQQSRGRITTLNTVQTEIGLNQYPPDCNQHKSSNDLIILMKEDERKAILSQIAKQSKTPSKNLENSIIIYNKSNTDLNKTIVARKKTSTPIIKERSANLKNAENKKQPVVNIKMKVNDLKKEEVYSNYYSATTNSNFSRSKINEETKDSLNSTQYYRKTKLGNFKITNKKIDSNDLRKLPAETTFKDLINIFTCTKPNKSKSPIKDKDVHSTALRNFKIFNNKSNKCLTDVDMEEKNNDDYTINDFYNQFYKDQ